MIYTIAGIIAALGSIGAWIYSLLQQNRSLKDTAAQTQAADTIKEWSDKIAAVDGNVTEEIKDYEKLKETFNANNSNTTK